jgi:hypothetical protein
MRSTKFQAPAFAEAASRRQAHNQIITKAPMTEIIGLVIWKLGDWKLFGIWVLEFGI